GCPKTGRDNVRSFAVCADSQQRSVMRYHRRQRMAARLRIVEIALLIRLQSHRKLMEVLCHLMVVVKTLVEVDFAIAVQIMQHRQLIAANDMDLIMDDL